jgi:hypothetical protein
MGWGLTGARLVASVASIASHSGSANRWANELWSWDITKLLGPGKWTYFYLYAMLDVFYAAHPKRFPAGPPHPPARPMAVWINPPKIPAPLQTLSAIPPSPLAHAGAFA